MMPLPWFRLGLLSLLVIPGVLAAQDFSALVTRVKQGRPQPKGELIHALEHGQVVAYYEAPGFKALSVLKRWTGQFAGPWSGLIAVPHAGMGDDVVLTAWRRRLRLDAFDEAALAAFMDAYMGRGPEKPVR